MNRITWRMEPHGDWRLLQYLTGVKYAAVDPLVRVVFESNDKQAVVDCIKAADPPAGRDEVARFEHGYDDGYDDRIPTHADDSTYMEGWTDGQIELAETLPRSSLRNLKRPVD